MTSEQYEPNNFAKPLKKLRIYGKIKRYVKITPVLFTPIPGRCRQQKCHGDDRYISSVKGKGPQISMTVLGIDPGYAIVGYGVLRYEGYGIKTVAYGAITTDADTPFPLRLSDIYRDMNTIIDTYKPDVMSIERLYFTNNRTTGIDVAQARGVIMLAAVQAGLGIYEYTPLQVKQSVAGYGKAQKRQVMEMTKSILGLKAVPRPDDTADALALAVCHCHTANSLEKMKKKG